MLDNAIESLSHLNMYSIPLIIILCIFLLSFLSDEFKKNMKVPLQACIVIWVIFFGYKVYTGKNLYHELTSPSQSDIEAAKYKKVMIDGREVIYNKETGEIVKKPKQ